MTALVVVLLVAHQAWVSWTQSLTRIALSRTVQQSASRELMSALLASDYAALARRRSGSVVTTLGSVSTVVDRYVDAEVTSLTQGASVLASFAVLAHASLPVAGVVVLLELLIAAVCYGLARFEASHTRHLLERTSAEQQLELSRDARAPRPAEPLIATSDQIVLDGVGYHYGAGRWVVNDHSQRIERGSVVDLRSPSGSGKTTLLRLVAGLLPPSRGRITVFGIDATRARERVL